MSTIVFFKSTFSVVTFGGSIKMAGLFDRVCRLVVKGGASNFSILRIACSVKLTVKVLVFFGRFNGGHFAMSPAPVRVRVHLCRGSVRAALIRGTTQRGGRLRIKG